MGFGREIGSDSLLDAPSIDERALIVALQEEDHSDLDDRELARFLLDAGTVEPRYRAMLATLKKRGTKIVRHGTDDDESPLEAAFAAAGLKILGPTQEQLLICSDVITRTRKDAVEVVRNAMSVDASPLSTYRRLMASPTGIDLLDRPGKGAAFNNQSIVLKLGSGDNKILLAGDMQFAEPEVAGLGKHMEKLRSVVKSAGPYNFIKASHHTSYNALDESVLEDLGNPPLVGHSGGSNDPGHPDRKTLGVLKKLSRNFKYARTDRNGVVTVGSDGFEIERGRLNDFTPNAGRDFETTPPERKGGSGIGSFAQLGTVGSVEGRAAEAGPGAAIDVVYMRIPYRSGRFSIGGIAIALDFASAPLISGTGGRTPQGEQRTDVPLNALSIAGGRPLPKLLFATSHAALGRKLGADAAERVVRTIYDSGQSLCDVSDPAQLASQVRRELGSSADYRGVVLLGGYDVVPSERVDVLDAPLRRSIGGLVSDDPDNFVVWSDDFYGDIDGDGIAERPVSRIPDGDSASFLMSCLSAGSPSAAGRFGIRNSARPFADEIWSLLPGNGSILVSGPAHHRALEMSADPSHHYFMLHGDFHDSSRFWGEDQGLVEAINVDKVPRDGVGVVFAGCCWGALTVTPIAAKTAATLKPKLPENSMALALLRAGARGFIGCTGAHYSPDSGASFFGGPMHKHFWEELAGGTSAPAEALFNARKEFLAGMPHGLTHPFHIGIERKIYKQFTCLGLGW